MPDYRIAQCSFCSLIFDPEPQKNLISQYKKSYFVNNSPKGGYANYFEGMRINSKTFLNRLKKFKNKITKNGRVLDVGCALGDCLIQAKKLGWINVLGIDPSAYAIKTAKSRGLSVKQGTLKTVNFENNSFDLVLSQDQIEHITDPVPELKRMAKILKPGGWLFLVTPDTSGFWAKILGRFWYHYKPGEHITYFSKKTISIALKRAGFKEIRIKSTYHTMSVEYILNRLTYYSPFFSGLLKIIKKTPLKDFSFLVYTGELEAWAKKSK